MWQLVLEVLVVELDLVLEVRPCGLPEEGNEVESC